MKGLMFFVMIFRTFLEKGGRHHIKIIRRTDKMKSKDRMIRAIRNRKNLESPVISLKKLLASGGMEHYLDLCSDRLADELMIDGEDTKMNFADFPGILFTESGLFDCWNILEKLSKLGESGRIVRRWIMWEIWSRTPLSGILRKGKEVLARIHVRVKYRWLFDMVGSSAAKYN